MHVLVTGGGGFLGRYIVEQLIVRGDTVNTIGRGTYPELEKLGANCFQGDLQNIEDVKKAAADVELVFHVAALLGIWGKYNDFYGVNVKGTLNIISACKILKIPRLVYTSSPSVIFAMEDLEGVNESQPYPEKYSAYYPQTKAIAEQAVLEANSDQLSTCSLRPHAIWGPRDNLILPMLVKRTKAKQLTQVGDGKNIVDFCYVENAAHAHVLAADALSSNSAVAGNAYFISDDNPIIMWKWIEEIMTRINIPLEKKYISESKAMFLAGILEKVHRCLPFLGEPRITRFVMCNFAKSHYFDISNAKSDFAYQPIVKHNEGMVRTAEWYNGLAEKTI